MVCTHNLDEAQRVADIVGIINRRLLVCDNALQPSVGAGRTTSIEMNSANRSAILKGGHEPSVREEFHGKDRGYIVEVENPTTNIPYLVRALVDSKAKVYAVRPKTRDLETVYLQCVSEKGVGK